MLRGGRRRVSVYTQRDRENKRFVKKVAKAVTPSKRTQRAIAKALFAPSSVSSNIQANKSSSATGTRKRATLKDVHLSPLQWIGCLAVAAVCTYPVFASGAFDGSSISWLVLFFFFFIPFFTALLVVVSYNATLFRSHPETSVKVQPDDEMNFTFVEAKNGDFEIAEINAPLYMDQFKDSLQIMQKTADPETFFSRFDFAREKLENMAEYEKLGIKFSGSPSALLSQFDDETNIADTVNVLIDNSYKKQVQKISTLKTARGRSNSSKRWYESFEPYFERMPLRSKSYLDLKMSELEEAE